MSFNPFAAGGVDVDKLPYFVLRKVQSIGTSHGFELVKIEPMRDNRETSMGRLELEDLFVRSGEIVKGTEVPEKYNPDENKTYMHLILSDDEGTEVYIDVTDLIDMPDAGKVPLDNDNTLTVEQLNLIKKIFGDNISANTTVLDIILSIASIFENTEIWAEDVRVKNVANGGTFEFQYVFKPNKSTDQVQLALQNIDKEFKIVHDNITTIGQTIVNLETKVDNNYTEINDKITIIDNSIDSINNSITTIEGNITEINTNIGDMNKIITNHTTAINTINEQITNINKTISDNYTDLSKKITAINNSLTEYKNDIDYKITNINNSLSSLNTDRNAIVADIKTINSKITKIQESVTALDGRVTQNEKDIAAIKEELKKLVLTGEKTLYGTINIANQKVKISESIGRHSTEDSTGEIFNDYTDNIASGNYSHSSGYNNQATADYSVAMNIGNRIAGNAAFGCGYGNTITDGGYNGHASGFQNRISAGNCQVSGSHNKVVSDNEIAAGQYNLSTLELPLARSIGNGKSNNERNNLEYLTKTGNHYIEGSYLMHDLPENADLNNYGSVGDGYDTRVNIYYKATGIVAPTIKNIPNVVAGSFVTNPKKGFILKVMQYDRQLATQEDTCVTAVQILYAGTGIFMRTYILDISLGWTEWVCLGGISSTGGGTAIALSKTQQDYIKMDPQNSDTNVIAFYYSNLIFAVRCNVTPNINIQQMILKIDDTATFVHNYINSSGYAYGPNEEEFKYVVKDKNTIVLTCTDGFKANSKYGFTLFGMYEPID